MKFIIMLAATVAALIILAVAYVTQSTSSESVDQSIEFASDGNIYMSQELCDAEDPDISEETEKRLKAWWDDVLSGKIDGRVICTD